MKIFLNEDRLPVNNSVDEAWQKQKEKISLKVSVITMKKLFVNYTAYAAGFAAIFFLAVTLFNSDIKEINTAMAEQRELVLPDGSKIWLNAESELTYNEDNWEEERRVQLKGEAFFQVNPGNSFIVETEKGNVEVLGTSFNVFSRFENFEVACQTGKVKVFTKSEEVILLPLHKTQLNNGKFNTSIYQQPTQVGTWINGEFTFEDAELGLVLQELQRQFNVRIDYISGKEITYTGKFTTENLNDALQLVCVPLGLHYQISKNGKVVTIK